MSVLVYYTSHTTYNYLLVKVNFPSFQLIHLLKDARLLNNTGYILTILFYAVNPIPLNMKISQI